MERYVKPVLPALLLAVALILASCGNTGGSAQSEDQGGGNGGGSSGGMAGMDPDHMGHGSGGMASGTLPENGKYSDKRFIDAMVPHHQGAIAMACVALKNAEHEEIIARSRSIVSTQQAEIGELKSLKKREFGTSRVPMEISPQQMQSMGMMMNPEQLAHSKPFDRAFIDAMITYHQSAIEMARVAFKKSKNPEIEELAENIVSAQKREIEQMEPWRREWYPES